MFKTVLLSSAALFAATPAIAADFVGPRVEARLGWDRTTLALSYRDDVSTVSDKGHDDGFAIGTEAGYDVALGSAIVGGYAGAEWASTKECSAVYGDDEACLKLGRNFTLGARVGAAVTTQAMLYVKGGYSNGQLKATYRDFTDPSFDYSDRTNRGGFHLGVGAEVNVSETGFLKAEVIRTNYNDYAYSDGATDIELDSRRTQAIVGFGLRF